MKAHVAQRRSQCTISNLLSVSPIIRLERCCYDLAKIPLLVRKTDELKLAIFGVPSNKNLVGFWIAWRRESGFADRKMRIAPKARRKGKLVFLLELISGSMQD